MAVKINPVTKEEKVARIADLYEGLTPTARSLVMAYNGNIRETAQRVGCTYSYARALFANPAMEEIIQLRGVLNENPLIASRDERLEYWTRCMFDPKLSTAERLKASELLGKAYCDFSERSVIEGGDRPVEHRVIRGVEERIQALRKNPDTPKELTSEADEDWDFLNE